MMRFDDEDGGGMIGRAEVQSGRGWRIAVWGGAAALMLVPVAAMRLSDQMHWDPADFILVGLLLLAACGTWELAFRAKGDWAYAAGAVGAAGTAFLLFLVNGAVGLLGNEHNPVNLIFFAVVAVLAGGAVIVRARAGDMARVLAVTAGAQVAAGAVGLLVFPDLRGFLVGTALFVPLWLASAWLFGKSARK